MPLPSEGSPTTAAWQWLDANWQYAGVVASLFYLASLFLLMSHWALPDLLLWLQLPIYVAHQLEEHIQDRFRRFVNVHMGHGQPVLTPRAVMVINVGGVWFVDFLAVAMVRFGSPGFGLLAVYLAIVNAIVHLAGGLVSRAYNPGLITAGILLLPVGSWGAIAYSNAYAVSLRDHFAALAFVIALHLAIISHVLRRRANLTRASSTTEPVL